MKLTKIAILIAAIALVALACSKTETNTSTPHSNLAKSTPANTAPSATATPDELAAAKKIFSEKCVGCHKDNGTGGEKDIDGVKIKVPDLTSEKMKAEPDTEFVDIITNGAKEDGMPAFKGKISDQEIKDLVKLIRKEIQKK